VYEEKKSLFFEEEILFAIIIFVFYGFCTY